MKPSYHGGLDYAELASLGIPPDEVLDFSVSCNPFGPPPEAVQAAAAARIDRYPDRDCLELRKALAGRIGVDARLIVAGAGSTEVLRGIALAFLGRGGRALVVNPTYGEYADAVRAAGGSVAAMTLTEEDGFRFDVDCVIRRLRRSRCKALFICNPNNPTGEYLNRECIYFLLRAVPDCMVVLDEAYAGFVEDLWDSMSLPSRNLIIVRSLTKDYSLAGLRLGYAVARRDLASALARVMPPWSVSAPAQAAGVVVAGDTAYFRSCKERVAGAKAFLVDGLQNAGYVPLPSAANFVLMKVGDGAAFRSRLLKQRVLVRDCASFGLPAYVRIGVRTLAECQKLVEALVA